VPEVARLALDGLTVTCTGETVDGLTVTFTGKTMVTPAVAFLLGSALLVAVTVTIWKLPIAAGAAFPPPAVTVWGLPTAAGAVYRPPLEIVPTAGLTDQVTPVLGVPVTVAINC
jgi:hypothetical protein